MLAGKLKPNLGRFNVMLFLGNHLLVIINIIIVWTLIQSSVAASHFFALQNPPDWQEILTYFRGSELQNYFTRILEDNLKVMSF